MHLAVPVWVIIVVVVVGVALILLATLIIRCVACRAAPYDRETLTGDGEDDEYGPTRKVVVRRGRIVPASWNMSLTASMLFGDKARSHQDLEETGGRRSRSPFGMFLTSHDRVGSPHSQMSQAKIRRQSTRQGNMELLNDVDENFLKRTPDATVTEVMDPKKPQMSMRSYSLPSTLNDSEGMDQSHEKRLRPPTAGTLTGVMEEAEETLPRSDERTVPAQHLAVKPPKSPRSPHTPNIPLTTNSPLSPTFSPSSLEHSRLIPPKSKFSQAALSPWDRSPPQSPLPRSPLSLSSVAKPFTTKINQANVARPRTTESRISKSPKIVAPPIAPPPKKAPKSPTTPKSRPLIPSSLSLPNLEDFPSSQHPTLDSLPAMLPQSSSSNHNPYPQNHLPSMSSMSVATPSEMLVNFALDEGYERRELQFPPPVATAMPSPAPTLKSLPALPGEDTEELGKRASVHRVRSAKGNVLRKKSMVDKEVEGKGKQRKSRG